MKEDYIFRLPMKVRDYEVDVEGIVNNANYLHYLEHTRHEFCAMAGFSFRDMHLSGIDPVLAHVDISYRTPLTLGQEFESCLRLERKGPRFVFYQDIYTTDGRLVVEARVTCVTTRAGRLTRGDELAEAFGKYL